MTFGDKLSQINGDRSQPSFTGITGSKSGFSRSDDESEDD